MTDRIISEEEQKEVEQYVLERELYRPKTNIFTVLKYYFVFLTSIFGITVLFYLFLRFCFPVIAQSIEQAVIERPRFTIIVILVACHIIGFIVVLKNMVIGFVHLYQHYSPEHLRRSCLFKPTCSEYMLLAIEKYGFVKGVSLSFKRFRRCNGETYQIDYP